VIVVSDTTPLNYLVLIHEIDLLPALFKEVYVPPSVIGELTRSKTPEIVRRWVLSSPAWLKIVAPVARLPSTASLDDGEADALSLAKELQIPDVLIDERRGRKIAQREGLNPVPTLAILQRAAEQNLLQLAPALAKLQLTNIRIPKALIDEPLFREAARKTKK
jgi:predicted nucleic acid-binding protein